MLELLEDLLMQQTGFYEERGQAYFVTFLAVAVGLAAFGALMAFRARQQQREKLQ